MTAKVINCQLPLDQLVDITVAILQSKGRGRPSKDAQVTKHDQIHHPRSPSKSRLNFLLAICD
ncbi:hypothetical protein [Nostoc sp.]|uniref:hypothetical protein n=1 Tax=Nostoc sp. TaxID=1180 RepID=UPI002FFA8195